MLKLPPANHLALTDTLYTALNNVRAYLFRSFKFLLKVGVEESIVNALRITDHRSAV
jgi:hypothetical protein